MSRSRYDDHLFAIALTSIALGGICIGLAVWLVR